MVPLTSLLVMGTALLVVYLETVFSGLRHVLGTQPNLLPSLMVYTSLSHGLPTITVLAILGGLCFDSLSSNPLGVTIVPLFLCGLAIYVYRTLILREQLFAQVMLGLGASALSPALTLLILLNMSRQPLISWASLWQWIILAALGAAVTPFWFWMFDRVSRAVNYRPSGETTFRADREIKRSRYR